MKSPQEIIQDSLTRVHDHTRTKLADLVVDINSLTCEHSIKIDLLTMHQNARKVWARMDNEMIQCRRRGKFTSGYQSLNTEIQTIFKLIDREVFWLKLH